MKLLLLLITFITTVLLPLNVQAQTYNTTVSHGITQEGIDYQAISEVITFANDQITFQMTYIYEGDVIPPLSIYGEQTIDGYKYSGTLYLYSKTYNVIDDQTTAIYRGTLYKVSSQ